MVVGDGMGGPTGSLGMAALGGVSTRRVLALLVALQSLLGLRVALRLMRGARSQRIRADVPLEYDGHTVSVVVPVLDEYERLAPCLDGLIAQGSEVAEILVVDGGSVDGTQDLVARYAARDARIRLCSAAPIPAGWNGKAWGLEVGLRQSSVACRWLLTVDADVRPSPLLVRALLAHAQATFLPAFSVATRQEIAGMAEGLLHPSMLSTLVYRFGPPGRAICRVGEVQANGQCFLARRDVLQRCDAFATARASRCEDVTVARCLVAAGYAVGFYEADDLVSVRMYADWRDTWRNWPRSLPMRDPFSGLTGILGLCEVALVQALPLPIVAVLCLYPSLPGRRRLLIVNAVLMSMRLGVLAGTARAYRRVPWSYWLSPLGDVPVTVRLIASAMQRRHVWRGRVLVGGVV